MSFFIETINNFTRFMNDNNIPFVIGGSVAIKYLCNKFGIQEDIDINNLDIFYLANTPITTSTIYGSTRIQSAPHTTMSYQTSDGLIINLTLCRMNKMRFIQYQNIKFMHPSKIISYYYDEFNFEDTQFHKINLLLAITLQSNNETSVYITRQQSEPESDTLNIPPPILNFGQEPPSRRLFY